MGELASGAKTNFTMRNSIKTVSHTGLKRGVSANRAINASKKMNIDSARKPPPASK
jgi:hypothetical protein